MKLTDLLAEFAEPDTGNIPAEMKAKAFTKLFSSLHRNRVVYREKFIALAELQNLEILPMGIRALAVPVASIEHPTFGKYLPDEPWTISCSWDSMRANERTIVAVQVGWSIWPDSDLVERMGEFLKSDDQFGARDLIGLAHKPEVIQVEGIINLPPIKQSALTLNEPQAAKLNALFEDW